MANSPRRFLVVPDPAWDSASLVSVIPFSGETPNQAGRQVSQPERSATTPPAGDIGLTLTGEPETDVAGVARVTRAGVVEDARWGWIRDGDSTSLDLQFRQSPHVVGRRVDIVDGMTYEPPAAHSRAVRPRLLPLLSGDVLMVWTERYWMPIWGRQASTLAGSNPDFIYLSRLDHTTDTWGAVAAGPVPYDVTGLGSRVSAVDIAQFPDTGEIIMCVATSDTMVPGIANVDPRIMFVYQSVNNGTTWTLKHRLHMDGPIPDILLDIDGDGDIDDDTAVQDWALELLDSGRLCLFTVTEKYTWSLTSDDRGASWAATLVYTHVGNYQYAGHGCGASKARNGMGCFVSALRYGDATAPAMSRVQLWFSRDGVSFSGNIGIPSTQVIFETADITCAISPDGWPHIYGTEHVSKIAGAEEVAHAQDWLWGRRLKTRDPSLSDALADVTPDGPGVYGPATALHLSTGVPLGSYAVPAGPAFTPCVYRGFVGLDAVLYRGQILLAVVAQRDGTQPATDTQPDLGMFGLMVYRLNHWQPAQERVADAHQIVGAAFWYEPYWPAIGRIYNETWDCYDVPDEWGWAKTGAVVPVLTYAGTEGGYMAITGAPVYWQRPVSAGLSIGMAANLRVIVHVETGGDSASDTIAVRLALSDTSSRSDVSIRFKRSVGNVEVYLYDNTNAAFIGSTIIINAEVWVEVLYAQHRFSTTGVKHYLIARRYDRGADPDWDGPYTTGTLTATTVGGAAGGSNSLRFGHVVSGDPESWWKGVHLARAWTKTDDPQADEDCALAREGVTYIDNDAVNDRSTTGTGEPPLDNGLDNWMRTCRTLATPAQFMSRSTSARFRGEASTDGDWDYETGYAFAAANVQVQPVLREWRSVNDDTVVYMVFRAPTGHTFRPDAMAVFGHNVTGIVVQFNATDSWGTPAVSFGAGIAGFTSHDRYYHEWSINSAALSATGNRVTVAALNPWRPHQFKSDAGGQTHYLALHVDGSTVANIFRIIDNTSNTLILQTSVTGTGITPDGKGTIFSDRYAVMIGHHFPASPLTGYEYCQVVIGTGRHWDSDAAFARIGRIVFGCAVELSTPDVERGWSTGFDTGATITEQPTGAAYSQRNRPILRTWQADRPWMMPPVEAETVYSSPAAVDARASWAQWLDTCRLVEGGGVACALVWEGERFVGMTGEERVQCASDPLSLAMCHVTGLGELTNLVYDGRNENLAAGTACVARPVAAIRALTFRETL